MSAKICHGAALAGGGCNNRSKLSRALLASAIVLFTFELTSPSHAAESYDATVSELFHGSLEVLDAQCHHHDLTPSERGGVPLSALWAWGTHNYNVRVVSHYDNGSEIADEIYPRNGSSTITRCARDTQSFSTHVDGRLISWSEGNAVGAFDLLTSEGATRHFDFLAGKEPPVNGHHVFCENAPEPDIGCASLEAVVTFNRTRVRVFYRVIDSPDGPEDDVIRIQTLGE